MAPYPLPCNIAKGYGCDPGFYFRCGETVSVVNPKHEPPQSIQDTSAFKDLSSDLDFLHSTLVALYLPCIKKAPDMEWLLFLDRGHGSYRGFCRVIQKEMKMEKPMNSEKTLHNAAHELLDQLYHRGVPYRATGVTLMDLTIGKKQQFSLFESLELEDDKLFRVIDQIENKFGSGIIKIG